MIDRIHIEPLEIHARVGVADSERAQPQRLTLGGKPSTTHTTEPRLAICCARVAAYRRDRLLFG
jgi:hypothetical protein